MIHWKQKASPRESALALLTAAALLILLFRIVVIPARQNHARIKSVLQTLQIEKNAIEKFTVALKTKLPTLEGSGKTQRKAIQILEGTTAAKAHETTGLLKALTDPVFLGNVEVKEMSSLPVKEEDGYSASRFFLATAGNYAGLMHYLEKVENFPALMMIDQMTMKAGGAESSQLALELNGTLFQWKGTP